MNDYPLIETERLVLRAPTVPDMAAMYTIVSDPETARFLGAAGNPATHFERFARNAGSWMLYGYGSFMLRLRGSEEVIGNVGVFHSWRGLGADFDDSPEAGWILDRAHAGKGLAEEATRAALDWFDAAHGARRVVCMIAEDNTPSLRLAAKLGFAPMRKAELPDGDTVALLERVAAQ